MAAIFRRRRGRGDDTGDTTGSLRRTRRRVRESVSFATRRDSLSSGGSSGTTISTKRIRTTTGRRDRRDVSDAHRYRAAAATTADRFSGLLSLLCLHDVIPMAIRFMRGHHDELDRYGRHVVADLLVQGVRFGSGNRLVHFVVGGR